MDAYEKSNAYAQQRAAAEVGAPYKAGYAEMCWYRWAGSRPCGSLERGAMMENAHHEGLQVWDREQWHPMAAFGLYTAPAAARRDFGLNPTFYNVTVPMWSLIRRVIII